MLQAATMVAAFLICLGIFHCPCQLNHELLGQPIDSTQGHHSLGPCHCQHPLLLKCAKCTAGFFWSGWLPLSFLGGKKLVVLGLGGHQQFGFWSLRATLSNLPFQPPWQPLDSPSMSSPVDPPSGRLPLLLTVWEVCHKSDPSSTLLPDLGESNQGRKQLNLKMP